MNIDQVMKKNVQACGPNDSAKRAAQLMWDQDIGCLPVVDADQRPIAMITDRDLLMALHLTGRGLEAVRVSEAMSKKVFVARQGDSVQAAAHVMRDKQIRRLPVVDTAGKLVGIATLNDLALAGGSSREVRPEEVTATLASICQPRHPPQQALGRV